MNYSGIENIFHVSIELETRVEVWEKRKIPWEHEREV
jgi:hypothetical protein